MLPIGALFAYVGRQVGRLLQLAFNWATLVLFGQVSKDKQLYLSIMAGLSLLWPIAVAGVLVPSVSTFLLGFVTVPDRFQLWVRIAMLVIAILAPLAVGFLAMKLRDRRPRGSAIVRSLLAGYPNALALAVVLLWLMVVAPVTKLFAIAHRYDAAHVPVAVKPGGYDLVVDDLRAALERAGIAVRHTFAPWYLTLPGRVLALVGGAGVRALVPEHLSQLRGRDVVMTIHPMDLTLTGKTRALTRARGALVRELTFTKAYQTWTADAHEIEDAIERASRGDDLAPVGIALDEADIPFEEWEILYRMLLQTRLRRARVVGGDEVRSVAKDGQVGIWERIEAAITALTARP